MVEGKILAVARKPLLSRNASEGYDFMESLWRLNDSHDSHSGSPTITGVVTIQDQEVPIRARSIPRYKLVFPDGFVDYARIDTFNDFYKMEFSTK